MSGTSRPGRTLVISHDVASGEGHARHDADEITVLVLEDESVPNVADYDQVLVVGIADPISLAALVSALLAAPGAPEILVGGGVVPRGTLDEWSTAFGEIGIVGFDEGPLALAAVDSAGSGAGPVLYCLLAATLKESPRLVAPPRDAAARIADAPSTRQQAEPVPVAAVTGLRAWVARVRSSRRATLAVAAVFTLAVTLAFAVLTGVLGDAAIGAGLGVLLVLVIAHAVRVEQRSVRSARDPRDVVRLEKAISRQSALLEAHSEELAALRTSTSINELATVDIAKSLVRDVS